MDPPVIRLYDNPWREMIPDGVVLQALQTAATLVDTELNAMKAAGEVENEKCFGLVVLSPVRERHLTSLGSRVLASVEHGRDARQYLPNGLAKTDAHDRHGLPNGWLLEEFIHCLGDDDFIWGSSAEYKKTIAGGSGLSPEQDLQMANTFLPVFIDRIDHHLFLWVEEQKLKKDSHRWMNGDDRVPARYRVFDDMDPICGIG